MVSVSVSVDDKDVQKRLTRIQRKIDKGSKLTIEEMGKTTRDMIMTYMPKETGESRDSIGYVITTNNKGGYGVKVGIAANRRPHKDATWRGVWFNVPWYMFEGEQALRQNFHSGSIPMMRAVPGFMVEQFRRRIRVDMSNWLK